MTCKECGKKVAWHWSGLCGACAGFNPGAGAAGSANKARLADSLRREAQKVENLAAARDRRELREVPVGPLPVAPATRRRIDLTENAEEC